MRNEDSIMGICEIDEVIQEMEAVIDAANGTLRHLQAIRAEAKYLEGAPRAPGEE